jgi:hypothetical protein
LLLDRLAFAAPDNDEQHENGERSRDNANQSYVIHCISPFQRHGLAISAKSRVC